MLKRSLATLTLALAAANSVGAQPTRKPLPPIDSVAGLLVVGVAEFASLPAIDTIAARPMLLIDEGGTRRLFVNDMRGPIYSVSYDGKRVTKYVDINDSTWGVNVQSQGRERGMQSFAFHPDFGRTGTPGYGRFYTWTDSRNNTTTPDFTHPNPTNTHHTVLHEWTAKNPNAATYDGGSPRELARFQQPYANHNGGMAAFNPLARPGTPEYGLLYLGVGDGGSGGDPQHVAQNLTNGFGKIFRIDPLGKNSKNGKYGIPASNPFVSRQDALGEIYAYGVRNPQRFGWDAKSGAMYLAEIGQNTVEEISAVPAGGNLGWNVWEGSFKFASGGVEPAPRDSSLVYPVVEYQHGDPPLMNRAAATGVYVFRGDASVPALEDKLLFGDNPSGELFWVDMSGAAPNGGSEAIHRILLRPAGGQPTRLLDLVHAKNAEQGKTPATRVDLRFGVAGDGRVFILNKADGTIRVMTR
jgi:hypothetical protein